MSEMQYSKSCPNMKLQQIIFYFSLIIASLVIIGSIILNLMFTILLSICKQSYEIARHSKESRIHSGDLCCLCFLNLWLGIYFILVTLINIGSRKNSNCTGKLKKQTNKQFIWYLLTNLCIYRKMVIWELNIILYECPKYSI